MICFVVFVDDYQNTIEDMKVCYAVSYLRKHGYTCKVLILMEKDVEKLYSMVEMEAVKLIVFGLNCDSVKAVFKSAEMIKHNYDKIPIAISGDVVHNYEEKILEDKGCIDMVIYSEGEETLLDIASHIFKDEIALKDIKGICYRDKNIICKNESRAVISDLDTLPFPSRDMHEMYPQQFLYIVGSRGCGANCTFCIEPKNRLGKSVRYRSARNIVDEMKYLSEKYKRFSFQFLDPTFEDEDSADYNRSTDIFSLLVEENLHYNISVYSRAEIIAKAPEGYYELAKKAGLESIFVGIESGNNEDLKRYGKIARVEDNVIAIDRLNKHNISTMFGFINFNPYSTYDTLKANAQFLKDTGLGHNIRLYAMRLEVLPQSPMRTRLIRDGLMSNKTDYSSDVYDYIFLNEPVGKLARALSLKNIDHIQYGIDHMITLYENRIINKHSNLYSSFKAIFDDVKEIRVAKNELLYNMFNKCLDLAFEGASSEVLSDEFSHFNINQYDDIYRRKHIKLLRELIKNGIKQI